MHSSPNFPRFACVKNFPSETKMVTPGLICRWRDGSIVISEPSRHLQTNPDVIYAWLF